MQTAHFVRENPMLQSRLEGCLHAWGTLTFMAPGELISLGAALMYRAPMHMARLEIEDSYWLADVGLYRQAFASLRTALELSLMAVNNSLGNRSWDSFKQWVAGTYNYESFKRKVLNPIFGDVRVRRFVEHDLLKKEVQECYEQLCAFSHSRGAPHSALGFFTRLQPPSITRESGRARLKNPKHALWAQAFKDYANSLRVVTRCSVALSFIRYPVAMQDLPLFDKFPSVGPRVDHFPLGFVQDKDRRIALRFLSRKQVKSLQRLSDENPGIQLMVQHIRSLPDLPTLDGGADWDIDLHYDRLEEWFTECERLSLAAK